MKDRPTWELPEWEQAGREIAIWATEQLKQDRDLPFFSWGTPACIVRRHMTQADLRSKMLAVSRDSVDETGRLPEDYQEILDAMLPLLDHPNCVLRWTVADMLKTYFGYEVPNVA